MNNSSIEHFRQKIKSLDIPGGIFALIKDDKVIWKECIGYTDITKSKVVNDDTLFCLQSTTKTITAIASLIAHQECMFHLDDFTYQYLDNFHYKDTMNGNLYESITIRHLLSHTAGLPTEGRLGGVFNCEKTNFEDHINSSFGSYLISQPGTRFNYSNIGMDIVAYCIGKASQMPYAEFIEEYLAGPLNIKIHFDVEQIYNTGNAARGSYSGFNAAKLDGLALGCGGAFLSLNDLIKYAQFLLHRGEPILQDDDLYEEMIEIDDEVGYGLGVMKAKYGDLTLYNHPGGGFGFASELFWNNEENIAIIGLVNNEDVAFELKEILIDILKEYLESQNKQITSNKIKVGNQVTYNDLSKLCGLYTSNWGNSVIDEKNGNLIIDGTEYTSHENWVFNSENRTIKFSFNHDKISYYFNHDTLGLLKFTYIEEKELDLYSFNDEWYKYVGLYRFDLYCTDTLYIAIVKEDDCLYLYGDNRQKLFPISNNEFCTTSGETVIFEDNIMYSPANTKCTKMDNIVEVLSELKQKEPKHRHLTLWMLDMCVDYLNILGKKEEATKIEALKD